MRSDWHSLLIVRFQIPLATRVRCPGRLKLMVGELQDKAEAKKRTPKDVESPGLRPSHQDMLDSQHLFMSGDGAACEPPTSLDLGDNINPQQEQKPPTESLEKTKPDRRIENVAELSTLSAGTVATIEKYQRNLQLLIENMGASSETIKQVPPEVWTRVDEIFSGSLEPLRQRNRDLADQKCFAHLAAFLLQDFRNSPAAEEIANHYKGLDPTGKIKFEQLLKNSAPSEFVYQMLYVAPIRPIVFDPRQMPQMKAELETYLPAYDGKPAQQHYRILYPDGRRAFVGVDRVPCDGYEGNDAWAYDDNKRSLTCDYYGNRQPNFSFKTFDAQGNEIRNDYFKNYLGAKGRFFYYYLTRRDMDSSSQQIDLSDEQIKALRKFYHCEWEPQRAYFTRD